MRCIALNDPEMYNPIDIYRTGAQTQNLGGLAAIFGGGIAPHVDMTTEGDLLEVLPEERPSVVPSEGVTGLCY